MLYNNFIDNILIICISGNGGNGLVHFKKKNKKIGKPDGGDGGNGGNIIFIGDKNIFTFYNIKKKIIYKALNGQNGMLNCKTGKNGKDYIIKVPIGTIIKINKKKKINITKNNKKKIILFGGRGGKGNFFYKSSKNQKSMKYSKGENGEKIYINLILNIKIDISIIGPSNTGKSTILSIITNSKPKISNYDFTTLVPNLGIYNIKNKYKKLTIIDIPAVINNLNFKNGIGIKYLKYLKKCKLILLVIFIKKIKYFKKIKNILQKNILKEKIKKYFIIISKYDLLEKKNIIKIKNYFIKKKYEFCFFSKKKKKMFKKIINNIILKKYII
ncbi:MAG: 50S ribosome-binding GTPase [Candidatus Shikimatogenerans bostrichidophilus]|nr:MAG: 50S ribosome-binding GTPase [Candidatus Shikimatogenerans bostrichidophilus]